MNALVTLDQIARELEQHPEVLRIKKLSFYICYRQWENQNQVLHQTSLGTLLSHLYEHHSSIDILSKTMYRVVATLNRQDIYREIANLLIRKLGQVYQDSEESTQIIAVQPKNLNPMPVMESTLQQVAFYLTHHQESSRIHKLLYAAIYHAWENDVHQLQAYPLDTLLLSLRQSAPTIPEAKYRIDGVVSSLNRQGIYSTIAQDMMRQIERIYLEDGDATKPFIPDDISMPLDVDISGSFNAGIHPYTKTNTNSPTQGIRDFYDMPTTAISATQAQQRTIQQTAPEDRKGAGDREHYNIFDLRLEVMKYSNPLRVKILLFSAVYRPFDATGQDWAALRSSNFDEMLKNLLQSYHRLPELEIKLCAIAQSLRDPEEYLQTVGAIVQAVSPLYH